MRPLRARLEEARGRLGLPWSSLERDYLLSWILAEEVFKARRKRLGALADEGLAEHRKG